MLVKVKCFNYPKCHEELTADDSPVPAADGSGRLVTPHIHEAIWIGPKCRLSSKLIRAARSLMFKRLGVSFSGRNNTTTD